MFLNIYLSLKCLLHISLILWPNFAVSTAYFEGGAAVASWLVLSSLDQAESFIRRTAQNYTVIPFDVSLAFTPTAEFLIASKFTSAFNLIAEHCFSGFSRSSSFWNGN